MKASIKTKGNFPKTIGETWGETWAEEDDEAFLKIFRWARDTSKGKRKGRSFEKPSCEFQEDAKTIDDEGLLQMNELRELFDLPPEPIK